MRIGVLALQGAFEEHIMCLKKLSVDAFEIRSLEDLKERPDGIIFPGGESTVMGKLICELGIKTRLLELIKEKNVPAFGTCAGMILLAKHIYGEEKSHLGLMDVTVLRNAYGRQLGSFNTVGDFNGRQVKMTFIRAPYIKESEDESVKILSEYDGKIVAARQNNILATAFHPELTDDLYIHEYFINMCRK